MKRKEKNKTSITSTSSTSSNPELSPLEIAVLKEKFKLEEKLAKKWGKLSYAIILQINALSD